MYMHGGKSIEDSTCNFIGSKAWTPLALSVNNTILLGLHVHEYDKFCSVLCIIYGFENNIVEHGIA